MKQFATDGATLPLFFRRWIARHYPEKTLDLIDRGGRYHDWLAFKYPDTETHNRKRFIKLLRRYGVESEVVEMINFGLWVYDHCPKWLQKKLKQTAK